MINRQNTRVVPAMICACLVGMAAAQAPAEMLQKYKERHGSEIMVVLEKNTTITIQRNGTLLTAQRQVTEEKLTLKTVAGQEQAAQVYYSGLVPLEELEAWTLAPVAGKYKKMPVQRFSHKDQRDRDIFHDDSRSVEFRYPAVTPGAITHSSYTVKYPDVRYLGPHYFATSYPVESSTLTIVCDKDVEVEVRNFHIPEGAMTFSRTEKHGRVVSTYVMKNVPALAEEKDTPGFRYYTPHVQPLVREKANAGHDALMEFYQWYYGRLSPVAPTDRPALQAITDTVSAGTTVPLEKAERIFGWVQDHIKYVAVEDGENGFIPAPAAKVCSDRFGDCKGMANLLCAMLRCAGLDAHMAWTGSRELPYTYEELPATAADDHMIVVLRTDTGNIFLDATSSDCPFGMPSFFIQGKEVLMAVDSDHYELLRAPVVAANVNSLFDTVRVRVQGDDLVGHGVMRLRGYQRVALVSQLKWKPREKWKDVLRLGYMKLSNRYQPDSISVAALEDRNAELVVRYSFRLPGVVTTSGKEQFLALDLDFPWRDHRYPTGRRLPLECSFATEEHYTTVLEPEKGRSIASLPSATASEHAQYGYSCTYTTAPDGSVSCSTTYRNDFILLPAAEVDGWSAMVDAREHELNRSVVLTILP
jgi:hypothetical protein